MEFLYFGKVEGADSVQVVDRQGERLMTQRPEPFDLFFAVGFFHEDVVLNGISVFMYIANIALPVAVGFFE